MSDHLVDIRTPLAVSDHARVEMGQDGALHVRIGAVTVRLERPRYEELAITMARAMVTLDELAPAVDGGLKLVATDAVQPHPEHGESRSRRTTLNLRTPREPS